MATTTDFMIFHHVRGNLQADKTQAENMQKNYRQVATVRTESMDRTFGITNHIDCDWRINPEVVWASIGGTPRSTAIGDVITNCTTNESFMCIFCGWEKV